jgi:thymidylate synthase (FAD)
MRIVPQSIRFLKPKSREDVYASIEDAGRLCYKSEPTGDPTGAFIRRLIHRGHESVIEHEGVTALITTDRGVMAELTRHRLASFSIESTRYVRYDRGLDVIRPPFRDDGSEDLWRVAVENAEAAYGGLVLAGEPPQIARSVLPQCLATTIRMTANFREWRHILRLRTSPAAHPQIRELMGMAWGYLTAMYPALFFDLIPGLVKPEGDLEPLEPRVDHIRTSELLRALLRRLLVAVGLGGPTRRRPRAEDLAGGAVKAAQAIDNDLEGKRRASAGINLITDPGDAPAGKE